MAYRLVNLTGSTLTFGTVSIPTGTAGTTLTNAAFAALPAATQTSISTASANGGTVQMIYNDDYFPNSKTLYAYPAKDVGAALGTMTGYQPASGTGLALRSLVGKMQDIISVLDFAGVDPTGATDSTTGIQNAINAAYGGFLYIPNGTYLVSTLTINNTITMFGEGINSTNFVPAASLTTQTTPLLQIIKNAGTTSTSQNVFHQLANVHVSGFSIFGQTNTSVYTQGTQTFTGILVNGCDQLVMEDIQVYGVNGTGLWLSNAAPVRESDFIRVHAWYCANATNPAILIDSNPGTSSLDAHNEIRFYSCKAVYCNGIHLSIACSNGTAGTAQGLRMFYSYGGQYEGIPTAAGTGDVVSISTCGRSVNFIGGSAGQMNGYIAGTQAGYACVRLGSVANNTVCGEVAFIGGMLGGYGGTGALGGPGVVAENFGILKMFGTLITECAGYHMVIGSLPYNSLTIGTPSGNAQVYNYACSNDFDATPTNLIIGYPAGTDYGAYDKSWYLGSMVPNGSPMRKVSGSVTTLASITGPGYWEVDNNFTDAPGGTTFTTYGFLLNQLNHNSTSNQFWTQTLTIVYQYSLPGHEDYAGIWSRTNANQTGWSPWRCMTTSFHPITAVTAGASPYTYTNSTPTRKQVFVSGGTVSAISFNRGATTVPTGETAGVFTLNPNDSLVITYTVAPTINECGI